MSIEQPNIIDAAGIEGSNIVLTISDHLSWTKNINDHLLLLQEKVNCYLMFIESGQIWEEYGHIKNSIKSIVIRVAAKHKPNRSVLDFYSQVEQIIENAGFRFEFKLMFIEEKND